MTTRLSIYLVDTCGVALAFSGLALLPPADKQGHVQRGTFICVTSLYCRSTFNISRTVTGPDAVTF
jgi:hypothetical protein